MRWRKRWNLPLLATVIFSLTFTIGLVIGWKVVFQRNERPKKVPAILSRDTCAPSPQALADRPAPHPLEH